MTKKNRFFPSRVIDKNSGKAKIMAGQIRQLIFKGCDDNCITQLIEEALLDAYNEGASDAY